MIPGSGNYLVDQHDRDEDEKILQGKKLECGCRKGNCKCDADWDEID